MVSTRADQAAGITDDPGGGQEKGAPSGGFLLLDKPEGPSSFQALRPVKRFYRGLKVGFAGTLDPAASGLLLVGIGTGTRLLEFLEALPKTYTFQIRLGIRTDTYDLDGQVLETRPVDNVTLERVEAALAPFRGDIMQTPPVYSALKIRGKRACDRARNGEVIEIAPRPVHVYSLVLKSFSPDLLEMEATCSKGTYIRSLAHDLGQILGCGGSAAHIRRIAIGSFRVETARQPEAESEPDELLPLQAALGDLNSVILEAEGVALIQHGGFIASGQYRLENSASHSEGMTCQILSSRGALVALAVIDKDGNLCPRKVFFQS